MSPPPPQGDDTPGGDTPGGDTRPLADLTVDEVCRLLAFLKLGNSAPKDFNGEDLAAASDQDLKDAGMKIGANRTRLLKCVKKFVANGVPTKAIGCSPKP